MPSTLDRKRPFGTVYGDSPIRFEQDNKHFDGQGHEIDRDGKLIESPKQEWKAALEAAVVEVSNSAKLNSALPVTKPLEDQTIGELQKELKATTGKGARFGATREQIIEKIQAAR